MRKITPFASKFSKHLCNCILLWKSASFQSTGLPVPLVTPQRACLSFLYTLKICYGGKICCKLFWGQIEWAGLAVLSAYRWSCKLITGRQSLLWAPGLSPQDVWVILPVKKKEDWKPLLTGNTQDLYFLKYMLYAYSTTRNPNNRQRTAEEPLRFYIAPHNPTNRKCKKFNGLSKKVKPSVLAGRLWTGCKVCRLVI